MLAMTLQENLEGFTKAQIEGAKNARCLQAFIGHPSQHQFEDLMHQNCFQIALSHQMISRMLTKYLDQTLQYSGEKL